VKVGTRLATMLTRLLLLLYPPSFRKDMGKALGGDVGRRAEELGGSPARFGGWLIRLGASLLGNAFAAWSELAPRIACPNFSWLDLKLAIRMLVKYPGLTLTGGLGIAVAMAVVVGLFSTNDWYFHPAIPLPEGDRLVGLENWDRRTNREERRSLYDFLAWRTQMKSVEDLSAFQTVARNAIAADGAVEPVLVAEITPSGFRLARVPPLLGRTLLEDDAAPGAPPVVVIGYDVWRQRFESAHDIVGRDLRLGATVHTVVGVMPEGFAFPVNHRYWTPLTAGVSNFKPGEGPSIYISGRIAPGFDRPAAQAELTVIGDRAAAEFPDTHKYLRPEVLPYTYPFAGMSRGSADGLGLVNFLFSLVLIVVCANVAILIYARTATRMGEIAVRSALGASRGRIVGQLFAESLVLTGAAGAIGVLAVKVALEQAKRMHRSPEFWRDYSLSGSALAYGVALTLLAGVITGVVPALQATGRHLQTNLIHFNYGAAPRLGRTWTGLIVIQVALAVAAVPIVVALGWWQIREYISTPTFAVDQFLAGQLAPVSPERLAGVRAELSRRLDAEPGFAGHSFMRDLPGREQSGRVTIENDAASGSAAGHETQAAAVDAGFFRAIDIGVVAGRGFAPGDQDEHAPDVVIVNRAFSHRLLDDGNVLGRRIRYMSASQRNLDEPAKERWFEIVGVVGDIETNPIDRRLIEPRVYHPLKQGDWSRASVLLRVKGLEQAAAASRLREIAAAVDPTLTVDTIPLQDVYRLRRTLVNTAAAGIAVAGLSVLLLSAAGIYALMSFTVAQRRREIAIRLALGAQPGQLLGGVFRRALYQISLGVAVGIGLALLLDAAAQGEALMGNAGLLLSVMVVVMSLVGLGAVVGPARRGLRIEPSAALKGE
jgi:putative ABC transport system permease protein